MIRINVGSHNRVKAEAVENVFKRVFGAVQVKLVDVEPKVSKQPFGEDVAKGALERAKQALKDADYGVGIEAGLIWNEYLKVYFDVQFCAVIDQAGKITIGHGSGFVYPDAVIAEVKKGRTVGEVMGEISGIKDLGKKEGAIGFLSFSLLNRRELTEQAVLMALIPRIRAELY